MRRNKLLWSTFLALAAVVIVVGVVWAAPTFERHVLGSAGERVAAGGLALNGTLGEAVAGDTVAAGSVRVAAGFWPLNPKHDLYLPAILR
jgi:hypothetical protein